MLNLSCKKTYDGKVVLDVGGLIFEKGKRYAVIGSNGSGKTTMLKIIGGVIKPDKNAIFETDFPSGGNTICSERVPDKLRFRYVAETERIRRLSRPSPH